MKGTDDNAPDYAELCETNVFIFSAFMIHNPALKNICKWNYNLDITLLQKNYCCGQNYLLDKIPTKLELFV